MGEDCSFLVAFAAAPRTSRLPSVIVMWFLPIAVAITLMASWADGCSGEGTVGTAGVCGTTGSLPSTTTVGMARTRICNATSNVGVQGTATTELDYGGSLAISTSSDRRLGGKGVFTSTSIQPSKSRGADDELPHSDSSGVVLGSTLLCSIDQSFETGKGEQRQGRNSGGGVGWGERDEASRRRAGKRVRIS